MDNKLQQAVEREFSNFERNKERLDRSHEKYYEDLDQSDWPYDSIFDQPQEGLVQQEFVTYRKKSNGRVERETVTRRFYGKDDYQDSTTSVIL